MKENKKVLVAYFSRGGENYSVGNITKGNTQIIAEMIAKETGGSLFHIEPLMPYPADYDACVELARKELRDKAHPEVKGDAKVEDYDVVFVGYPNWCSDIPMPIYTFLEKHDWSGKSIAAFCTHEGSGIGSTANKLQKACKGATLLKSIAIYGHTAQNNPEEARQTVSSWLKSL